MIKDRSRVPSKTMFVLSAALVLQLQMLVIPVLSQARPYTNQELRSVESSKEAQIREIRNQEISQLKIALSRRLPVARSAELYYRLAELYLEAYRSEYLLEGKVFQNRINQGSRTEKLDHSASRPYIYLGIEASEKILKYRIPFAKLDAVYYFLAFYNGELGNSGRSLAYFKVLIERFPNSGFAFEGFREVGESEFEKGSFSKAEEYFLEAIKKAPGESPVRAQILHKLAWAQFRQRRSHDAVETLKRAISEANVNDEKYLSIKEEALRDLALFMITAGRSAEALSYYNQVTGNKEGFGLVLENLAKEMERQAEPKRALEVYEALLTMNPEAVVRLRTLYKLCEIDLKKEQFEKVLQRVRTVTIPAPSTLPDEDARAAYQNVKALIRRTATQNHEKFRKEQEMRALRVAEAYYSAYIEIFLKDEKEFKKERIEIQWYLADAKKGLGKNQEAAQLYQSILDSQDPRYAGQAGALLVGTLQQSLVKKSELDTDGSKKKLLEPSEQEKAFVAASDRLAETAGNTEDAREAQLRSASVLAGYRNTEEDAYDRALMITKKEPKTKQAIEAALLALQIRSDHLPGRADDKRYQDAASDLKKTISKLKENSDLLENDQRSGKKVSSQIEILESRIQVGTIAAHEKDAEFDDAAKGYENFALNSKDKAVVEKSFENAALTYLKVEDKASVERVLEEWQKRLPGNPRLIDTIRTIATQYLIAGDYQASAQLFETLGLRTKDASSLETAGRMYEGINEYEKAEAIYSKFLSVFSSSPSVWRVAMYSAFNLERAGNSEMAARRFEYCSKGPEDFQAECSMRLADIYMRLKDHERARKLFEKTAQIKGSGAGPGVGAGKSSKGKNTRLSPYVGYARFRIAEILESKAEFEPLVLPEAKLKMALGQRLDFFKKLSPAYLSAVEVGGVWAISALNRLAKWSVNFADEVDRIEPLTPLDARGLESFKQSLAAVSSPLRKKAIETWTQAYQKAVEGEILSPAIPEIADALSQFGAKAPVRAQGTKNALKLAGIGPDGGKDGRKKAFEKVRSRLKSNPKDSNAWVDYGNLIWGERKPLLSQVAYEQAMGLNSKNYFAANNKAVVLLATEGLEDWVSAGQGMSYLSGALLMEPFFFTAKLNKAALMNYYRLFYQARGLWEQVLVKTETSDAHDGIAIAYQGLGRLKDAEREFELSNSMSQVDRDRFSNRYHSASRAALQGPAGAKECLSELGELNEKESSGFEKDSIQRLKELCTRWKK